MPEQSKSSIVRLIAQTLLFTGLGGFILYILWQIQGKAYSGYCELNQIPPSDCALSRKLFEDFTGASVEWLVVASLLFMLSNLIRALRWQMLIRPLGYRLSFYNSFFAIMIAYFTNLGVPRAGEFVRAVIVRKYEGIPVEKAFGTIITGRIVDLICLLVLIFIGFILFYEELWLYVTTNLNIPAKLILSLAVAGLVAFLILVRLLRSNFAKEGGNPFLYKLRKLVIGFLEGLSTLWKIKNKSGFIFYSIAIWVLYLLMHYYAFFSYEPTAHLSFRDSILLFDFGSLGIVFPSPGGMGSYHAMIIEALKILNVDPVSGFSFSMITFFTITVFCNVFFGLLSLILLPLMNRP